MPGPSHCADYKSNARDCSCHEGWVHATSYEDVQTAIEQGLQVWDRDGDLIFKVHRNRQQEPVLTYITDGRSENYADPSQYPQYTLDIVDEDDDGDVAYNWEYLLIDEALKLPPVTDEDMAEVYRILGVGDAGPSV